MTLEAPCNLYKSEDFENIRGQDLAQLVDKKCCEIEQQLERKFSLPELVAEITTVLQAYPKGTTKSVELIAQVKALLESYDASGNEWKRYALFDDSKNYTRNLVATDNETFTLMLLCWNKKKASPIHDHAGSECWLRMLSGSIVEHLYEFPQPGAEDQPLTLIKKQEYSSPGVTFINDCVALHKVENASEERAVSMHLYAPPYDSCQCFLAGTGKAAKACVTFYSENGQLLSDY